MHECNLDEILFLDLFKCAVKMIKPHCCFDLAHVLVHCVKSIRAYNVKSFSTLFSDNIQWSFEIPFPCARFKSLVCYNLITKGSNHQKWDVQAPISWTWKNTLSCEIYFFEKHWQGYLLNLKPIKMDKKSNTCIYKLLKPLSKVKSTKYYMKHVLRTAI